MYLNGKKIFATINNKRTLPIVSGSSEEPYTEVRITLTEDTGKTLSFTAEDREYTVDWGDGVTDSYNYHTYDDYGDYILKMRGEITVDGSGSFFRSGKNSIKYVRFNAKVLGDQGLYECEELERVEFSGLETIIPNSAFEGSGLRSVTIPDSVRKIDQNAFENCTRLTSVTLGSDCRILDWDAFKGCSSLTNINLGFVTEIGMQALVNCGFSNVDIGHVSELGYNAFGGCRSLVSITIPSTVKTIPELCFSHCESLIRVDLPLGIEYIGNGAFRQTACDIYYAGTRAQWGEIQKSNTWDLEWYGSLHCIDD